MPPLSLPQPSVDAASDLIYLDKNAFIAGGDSDKGSARIVASMEMLVSTYTTYFPEPLVVGSVLVHKLLPTSPPIVLRELLARSPTYFETRFRRASADGKPMKAEQFSSIVFHRIMEIKQELTNPKTEVPMGFMRLIQGVRFQLMYMYTCMCMYCIYMHMHIYMYFLDIR